MKILMFQPKVTADKSANLAKVEKIFEEEKTNDIDFLVLPEMFNCPYEAEKFADYAEEIPGPTTDLLSRLASEHGVYIVGGSMPERSGGKVYNTSPVLNPTGNIIGVHRKIHLFQVNYPGRIQFDESKYLEGGNEQTVLETEFGSIGIAICYDLRFPELLRGMAKAGSRIIFLPAAFNTTTGPAHWKPVLRTRAIDNQTFVVAASPARNRESNYRAYGHSLVVDPWGEVLIEAGVGEEKLAIELDLEKIEEVRKRLPLLESLRPEVYSG
ncbi:carbon-nitrogen hydrolase family protein [Candidatus Bipolaricaulota bacterium]|nr:carbon-nitrogen hydrolase family protein [Candidatus Bipolaricaulota bacterium]